METVKHVPAVQHTTHTVFNQPPPLVDYNLFTQDAALVESVLREGAGWAQERLSEIGAFAGREEVIQWGFDANTNKPVLQTHDRYGHRIDEVVFHPAYHHLMNHAVAWGMHASSWRDAQPGSHVARAAALYLFIQVEAGHSCPISMTYAAIPVIRKHPHLAQSWLPGLLSLEYDHGLRPATEKKGILCGMGMTEKQGGSDVRSNTTDALPDGDGNYLLTGHKWFCSAPMCDIFLVLAQAPGGLSCFLLPRILPDGSRNRFLIQRLKEKLGNRSNASSEVEFNQAWATLVGEEGKGVQTIIEMVNFTRLDCVLGTAALMRQAVAQATHHATYRQAFSRRLLDQPLMQNVLADLAIESEAATILAMRLARACDQAETSAHENLIKRLGTAIGKYWIAKRGPVHIAEALECLGGNGYVEESIMPRLYREAPLNSIWEGSGNVNALDVLRALTKEPQALESLSQELAPARKADPRLDAAISHLQRQLADTDALEWRARYLVEQMALVFQGALLVQHGHSAIADAFCATRLSGDWGRAFGTLPRSVDATAIIERSRPKLERGY
jgi:putative acyl-CoA dehydrogenase